MRVIVMRANSIRNAAAESRRILGTKVRHVSCDNGGDSCYRLIWPSGDVAEVTIQQYSPVKVVEVREEA